MRCSTFYLCLLIWQMGLVKHFFFLKKTKLFFFKFTFMLFSTVIDPVWNDGRWTIGIKTVTNPGFHFFFNNVLCVSDVENQNLVKIFCVHHFNSHVTLQTVEHMGNVPLAQLLATSLSHFFSRCSQVQVHVKHSCCHFFTSRRCQS